VAFGVLLPTMHQSGLGGLAVLFGQKLSPLWQTPFISLLFLISSIFMGLCIVTVVESWVVSKQTLKKGEYVSLLGSMIKMARNVAIFYVLFRWFEIIRGGGTGKAFEFGLDSFSFWMEWILILIGIFIISKKQNQTNPKMIFVSAAFMLASGLLYRINTYLVGFHSAPGVSYFPSFPEIMISVGMFALQLIIFITFIKIFPVLTKE
jgi:Ni/Fe-hydrogenase subunit HybB-like protein